MVSSIPDGFAKPQETPVNVELPIPKGSPESGFAKPHETPSPAVASFPGATSCPARYAEPRTIAFPAKWKEAQAQLAQEIESRLAQVSLLVKCSIVDNSEKTNEDSNPLEPPILAAGISNPAGSHQGQPQLAISPYTLSLIRIFLKLLKVRLRPLFSEH
ncbi:unnamed protein product [Caenorhabditis nigoni]